jgi:maltose alpha-D-glucosyltransferase/alpha-amylase
MPTLSALLAQAFPQAHEYILSQLSENVRSRKDQELVSPKPVPLTLYSTYPDGFEENGQRNLHTLTNKLSYISNLGCNALHILPFFPSPLVDGGFDIADFTQVRQDLGTMTDFDLLLEQAQNLHVQVFIDLACNHVSQKHPWFEQAQAGASPYKDFFITSETAPVLKNIHDSVAHYQIGDDHMSAVIIFPEQAGELPHWVQGTDKRWYFHTFYPHQVDLNWNNPDVFIAIAQVIEFWTAKGVSLRLDAAPHLDKDLKGTVEKNTPRNHLIIELLRSIQLLTNPESSLIAEVVDGLKEISSYISTPERVQSDYVYNFFTLNGLWATLVTEDSEELLSTLKRLHEQDTSAWISFLRSHDALMLGFVDEKVVQQTHAKLIGNGRPFGHGLEIAGRLASLLENDPYEIVFAHFLLASMPGSIALFYGDEVGKLNATEYVDQEVWRKRHLTGEASIAPDQRDLGRGIIHTSEYYSSKGQYLYKSIQEILQARSLHLSSRSKGVQLLENAQPISAFIHLTEPQISVYFNPSHEFVTIPFAHEGQVLLNCNQVIVEAREALLPPRSGIWVQAKP